MLGIRSHYQNIVDPSQGPLSLGMMVNVLVISLVYIFRCVRIPLHWLFVVLVSRYFGRRDIVREGSFVRNHLSLVSTSTLNSMQLFIFSEVCFFGGFFGSLYYNLFDLDIEVGISFLYTSIDSYRVPLLNTRLLLISRIAVTWGHHRIHLGMEFNDGIMWSLVLGGVFLRCQLFEYINTGFSMSDRLYGSVFFALTGFHGFHVTIGCTLLLICVLRNDVQYGKGIGLECSIGYGHFVDVVGVGLYLLVYCILVNL